jgi:hypothetical protein
MVKVSGTAAATSAGLENARFGALTVFSLGVAELEGVLSILKSGGS